MGKVNAHGIHDDAARWIRNWLAGRRHLVCINKSYSNWTPVISGVPQGSVLGPQLFNIYINNLDTNIVRRISKFVDDTKLCHSDRNPDDITELQEYINKLIEWVNQGQMNYNVDKRTVMHIGHNNMQGNYNMSNQQLPTTDQQRDLRIIITKDLKRQKQTEKSCKMANRVLGLIARNFRYRNKELILQLYKFIVRPHHEHAVQFWSPNLKRNINKIEKMQRRATKMIPEIRNHSYHQVIRVLNNLISLVQKRLQGELIEVLKYPNEFTTSSVRMLFDYDLNDRTRNNGAKLIIKHISTSVTQHFYPIKITTTWNTLPNE